jgi:hypothetical protein
MSSSKRGCYPPPAKKPRLSFSADAYDDDDAHNEDAEEPFGPSLPPSFTESAEPQAAAEALPGEEGQSNAEHHSDDDESEGHCIICLQPIQDKTIIPPCSHEQFCFGCVVKWCGE